MVIALPVHRSRVVIVNHVVVLNVPVTVKGRSPLVGVTVKLTLLHTGVSRRQLLEQPSLSVVLLSSHCSGPLSVPSPQERSVVLHHISLDAFAVPTSIHRQSRVILIQPYN